jgi:putative peptidoglycan lipid II flippase
VIFSDVLVKIFASGFNSYTSSLASSFTRVSMWGIYFPVLLCIFSGYLQINKNFVLPTASAFPFNLIVITSILLSLKMGYFWLPFGMVLAMASRVIFLIPSLFKRGYKFKIIFNLKDPYFKKLIRMSIPVMLGVSVNQINILIDRTLASRIAIGGISALNYASKLNIAVNGIFVLSLVTVLYPTISRKAAEGDIDGLKGSVRRSINSVNIIVVPTAVFTMFFSHELVRFIFGWGAFKGSAVDMTSYSLFFYAIGLIGFGIRDVLTRAFYSLQDTNTPMINGTIGVIINIILNLILSRLLGIGGLALATSIAGISTAFLLLSGLRKKIGALGCKNMLITFVKISFAALATATIAFMGYRFLAKNLVYENVALLVSLAIGAIFYLTVIFFMNIEETKIIIKTIKGKIGYTH